MSQDLAVIHYNGNIVKNRLTGRVSVTRGDHYEAVSLTTLRKHGTGASDGGSSSSTRDATSAQTDTRLKRNKTTGSGRSDSSSKRVFKRVMTEKDKSKRHGLKRKRKFAESAAWKASSGGGRQKVCKTRNRKVRKTMTTSCE